MRNIKPTKFHNKKAVEMQFNWIFVLIAGAAIMLLFGMIIFKQKEITQKSTDNEVLKVVDAIITGASISKDTIKPSEIPDSQITLECNKILVGNIPKSYESLILFGPSPIKGDKIITQTVSFEIPYRATNLIFITSPQVRYIIVGSNNLANQIYNTLPSDIKKEKIEDANLIKNTNNYKTKIIFTSKISLDLVPKSLEKLSNDALSAIVIDGNIETGDINFYEKSKESWKYTTTYPYLKLQTLLGAIYSENSEIYKCNMENIFSRIYLVTKVYEERTKKIPANSNNQCTAIYQTALNDFAAISSSSSFSKQNIAFVLQASKSLSNQNNNAEKLSCTSLY